MGRCWGSDKIVDAIRGSEEHGCPRPMTHYNDSERNEGSSVFCKLKATDEGQISTQDICMPDRMPKLSTSGTGIESPKTANTNLMEYSGKRQIERSTSHISLTESLYKTSLTESKMQLHEPKRYRRKPVTDFFMYF